MTYTQKKERTHRFKLALRMVLPLFFLTIATYFAIMSQKNGGYGSMIELLILMLGVMVYFIFYLIYRSDDENITDTVSHTFTPDYFFSLYQDAKGDKTLIMISIENLWAINERYGVKNGNRVLNEAVRKISRFFEEKGIDRLPICRYKGGDFILFLSGKKEDYIPMLELYLAKYQNYIEEEIEVRCEGVIVDSKLSEEYESLVVRLYELLHDHKMEEKEDHYPISEIENEISKAIDKGTFSIGFWPVCCDESAMYDTTVKLIDSKGSLIHQSRYVPVLNRLNKMRQLESMILERIAKLCVDNSDRFVVTISPVTLRNPNFFEHAATLFERYPKARHKIVLLFEEREYCHQLERFKQMLAHYRRNGYCIALDRFGGTQTSLLYLKEIEFDMIRFDPVFSRHLRETGYQNVLQGLNLSAHLCGAKTWITMIEDVDADRIAQSMKINFRQGNYLGRILTIEDIEGETDEVR